MLIRIIRLTPRPHGRGQRLRSACATPCVRGRAVAPIGTDPDGLDPDGQPIKVSIHFTANQVVTAYQVVGGQKGPPSNKVKVKDFEEDYPSGLPQPVIDPGTRLDCGEAVGASAVVPGATWTVYAQDPLGEARSDRKLRSAPIRTSPIPSSPRR